MSNFKFNLGIKVRDIITGLEGIVTGRCEHITGCNTYGINPQKLENGKPVESFWCDENRLKVIGKGVILPVSKNTGADNINPDGTTYSKT